MKSSPNCSLFCPRAAHLRQNETVWPTCSDWKCNISENIWSIIFVFNMHAAGQWTDCGQSVGELPEAESKTTVLSITAWSYRSFACCSSSSNEVWVTISTHTYPPHHTDLAALLISHCRYKHLFNKIKQHCGSYEMEQINHFEMEPLDKIIKK